MPTEQKDLLRTLTYKSLSSISNFDIISFFLSFTTFYYGILHCISFTFQKLLHNLWLKEYVHVKEENY